MAESTERWAIVGGGMLGLTLAYRLQQQGKQVTIFEAADSIGGLASAWQLEDLVWDRHYHVTLLSDLHLRRLLQELGLETEMQWVTTKTGVYAQGQLYSVSNAIEFLQFPPLGLIDKLRLGLTILYGARIKSWRRLEKIRVTDWLRRWSGNRTLRKFWMPLLRAKLGENYRQASAAFIWAIIARLYAARRTGLKQELFGYLPGGYARLLARFGQVLTAAGVHIHLQHRTTQVRSLPNGKILLEFDQQPTQMFDQVVITTATPIAAQLCPQLTAEEKDRLNAIQYQGIVCASLLLKQPLSDYYVTNITDDWVPFTGVIEMTALVDTQEFGGRTLVYLPKYIATDDPLLHSSNAEIRASFVAALEKMYPHFHSSDVIGFQTSRVKYVLPIATLHYSDRLLPMQTSIAGLHLINSAHIVNGTLNVNETVQLAERAAALLTRSHPTHLYAVEAAS